MKQLCSVLVLVLIVLATVGTSAQDFRSPAIWQDEIVVDGQNKDWQQPFKLHNSLAGLSFAIANDSTKLYLCFEAIEPLYIVKMLRAGWSFQLSCKERKRRFNTSVVFNPMYIELDPKHDYVEKKEKKEPTFENWLDDYKLESNTYTTQGFKHYQKNALTLSDTSQNIIHVQLNYNETKAVYEIAIPLRELMPLNHVKWNERMKLKVYINNLEAPPEKGTLTLETNRLQPIGRQGGQVVSSSNAPTDIVQPKKLTERVTKEVLYYKASFSHDFYLAAPPNTTP